MSVAYPIGYPIAYPIGSVSPIGRRPETGATRVVSPETETETETETRSIGGTLPPNPLRPSAPTTSGHSTGAASELSEINQLPAQPYSATTDRARNRGALMPIRPENVARYPAEWPAISWAIRWIRALGRCECRGECVSVPTWHGPDKHARCRALNGEPHPVTGSHVVLTVAHLDHTPENVHPANLRAMCQGCHLRYDRHHHAETRSTTRTLRRAAAGELPLPFAEAAR